MNLYLSFHCFPQSRSEWKIIAKAAQKFPQCAIFERVYLEVERSISNLRYWIKHNLCSWASFHIQLNVASGECELNKNELFVGRKHNKKAFPIVPHVLGLLFSPRPPTSRKYINCLTLQPPPEKVFNRFHSISYKMHI